MLPWKFQVSPRKYLRKVFLRDKLGSFIPAEVFLKFQAYRSDSLLNHGTIIRAGITCNM